MENIKEGPSTQTIVKTVCLGCKYLLSDLSKTGRNPIRNYHCIHPDVVKTEPPLIPSAIYIGHSDDTPQWCPYVNGKFTKENIEKLLKNLELENSGYDEFKVTDIDFSENKTIIYFEIYESRRGTMGDNKITVMKNPFKVKVVLHERFEGGGDEEIIAEAITKYLNDELE